MSKESKKKRMDVNCDYAIAITQVLREVLNKPVDWSLFGDTASFYIYDNDYDYKICKTFLMVEDERLKIEECVGVVMSCLNNKELHEVHEASILEKVCIDLIEKGASELFYVQEGILICGDFEFDLADIEEYHVHNNKLKIYDKLDGNYLINFNTDEVEELD